MEEEEKEEVEEASLHFLWDKHDNPTPPPLPPPCPEELPPLCVGPPPCSLERG